MLPVLQQKNRAEFAKRYNGAGYAPNRDNSKWAEAYGSSAAPAAQG